MQTIPGQDFAAQVIFDESPELQFNFFDSYWTPAGHDAIELSPELQALLARDPIPDHSPIRALDHLLGKVFTDSALGKHISEFGLSPTRIFVQIHGWKKKEYASIAKFTCVRY